MKLKVMVNKQEDPDPGNLIMLGDHVSIRDESKNVRRCGNCTLCCRLMPMAGSEQIKADEVTAAMRTAGYDVPPMMKVFDKPAGQCCPHQYRKGCRVYAQRPFGCRFWQCAWLANDDAADLSRPDHCHYVVDTHFDHIVNVDPEGNRHPIGVIQIWVDPAYPDAHRDPALRAYLERRGREGWAALIRYSNIDGFVLFPPAMMEDGQFHEHQSMTDRTREYNLLHTMAVLAGEAPV